MLRETDLLSNGIPANHIHREWGGHHAPQASTRTSHSVASSKKKNFYIINCDMVWHERANCGSDGQCLRWRCWVRIVGTCFSLVAHYVTANGPKWETLHGGTHVGRVQL